MNGIAEVRVCGTISMEGFPKVQKHQVTPRRSHSLHGLMETWNPRPDFLLGSHTTCIQETLPGPRAHWACCPGSHHLSPLGLAAPQALGTLGCLPVTLGRDGSDFNNLNTLLPCVEMPGR